MKTTITILLLAALSLTALQAQSTDKAVQKIRTEYNNVKKQIAGLEKAGYAGELYCFHLEDNVFGKSYPASGKYNDNKWFYYDLDGEDNTAVLKMVIEKTTIAGKINYRETLFIDGETAFIYEKNATDNNKETRLYCNDGILIRYTENNIEKKFSEEPEDTVWMRRNAYYTKETFDGFMNRD